jgi:predicted transcriptional regulator
MVGNLTDGLREKVLAQHGILSSPVLDNRTREYVGFVDVTDILRGLIQGAIKLLNPP